MNTQLQRYVAPKQRTFITHLAIFVCGWLLFVGLVTLCFTKFGETHEHLWAFCGSLLLGLNGIFCLWKLPHVFEAHSTLGDKRHLYHLLSDKLKGGELSTSLEQQQGELTTTSHTGTLEITNHG